MVLEGRGILGVAGEVVGALQPRLQEPARQGQLKTLTGLLLSRTFIEQPTASQKLQRDQSLNTCSTNPTRTFTL